jgi:hypothetical protein
LRYHLRMLTTHNRQSPELCCHLAYQESNPQQNCRLHLPMPEFKHCFNGRNQFAPIIIFKMIQLRHCHKYETIRVSQVQKWHRHHDNINNFYHNYIMI